MILNCAETESNHCTKLVIFANILKQALQKVPFISLQKNICSLSDRFYIDNGDFS